jgi:hypothetical protein
MREKEIEVYLRDQVKAIGGKAFKFVSPGNVGVPDRLILLPAGVIVFVEVKATGKKPTALQTVQQNRIRALGFRVFNLDSITAIEGFIDLIVDRGEI